MATRLEDLEVYQLSERLADEIWNVCTKWDSFKRETIGKQLTRSADSIGSNVAEGFGRYGFRENILFCHYARGSYFETLYWIRRTQQRNIMSPGQFVAVNEIMALLGPKLNAYINAIKRQLTRSATK